MSDVKIREPNADSTTQITVVDKHENPVCFIKVHRDNSDLLKVTVEGVEERVHAQIIGDD